MNAAPRPPVVATAVAQPTAAENGFLALMAINELIASLAKYDKGAKAKRRDERYELNQEVLLASRTATGQHQPLCVTWGLNISNSGLGLLAMQGVLPGRVLTADVSKVVGKPCRIPVRIVCCAPLTQGMHHLGTEFMTD